jgi:hypothetical protein
MDENITTFVGLDVRKVPIGIATAQTERRRAVSAPWILMLSPVMASVNRRAPIRRRQNQEIIREDRSNPVDALLDGTLENPPRPIGLAA